MITLRPFRTIKQLTEIADTRAKTIGLLLKNLELTRQINETQQALITLRDEKIKSLEKDLELLKAATVSTVDPITRDSVLDPPEPKTFLN